MNTPTVLYLVLLAGRRFVDQKRDSGLWTDAGRSGIISDNAALVAINGRQLACERFKAFVPSGMDTHVTATCSISMVGEGIGNIVYDYGAFVSILSGEQYRIRAYLVNLLIGSASRPLFWVVLTTTSIHSL